MIFAALKKLQKFAQKNTVCDHSLMFNPKKTKKDEKSRNFWNFFLIM
jgi:hypothetical protein